MALPDLDPFTLRFLADEEAEEAAFEHTCGTERDDGECLACGVRDCPHDEPLHYHHDGCPACESEPACGEANAFGACKNYQAPAENCPFDEEINNCETKCTCCAKCREQCQGDI